MEGMAYTILVADDEPAIRTLLEVLLSADGHEIVTVPDGRAALAYLRGHTPDALLLDVDLTQMNGFEVCSRVKRVGRLRGAAVLLLSRLDDDRTRTQARLAGADGLLAKPLSGPYLRGRVNELVQARRP
ncbi:response regulator [Deinococcus budaensis]|nr:response regulator [Deinococcus budaensis]